MGAAFTGIVMNHTKEINKDECLKRFGAAFDAVLDTERLSIHVRAHLMEALFGIQRSLTAWRTDTAVLRRDFIRLKEFMIVNVPESALPTIYERIESAFDASRELLDAQEEEADQRSGRFKTSF